MFAFAIRRVLPIVARASIGLAFLPAAAVFLPGGAAADVAGGLHGELDDVEEIDRDLRLRERAPGGGQEHGTHVDRDDLDPVPACLLVTAPPRPAPPVLVDPQVRHRRGIRLQQRVRPRGERVVRDGPVDPGVPGRMRWRGRDTTGRSAEKALEFDAA